MKKNHNIIEISAQLVHQTEKAILIKNLKEKDVWLPKSLIEIDEVDEAKGIINFQVPENIALERELL